MNQKSIKSSFKEQKGVDKVLSPNYNVLTKNKRGGEMVAEIKNEYGGCEIEKAFNFTRKERYIETVKIKIQTEAMLSPEQAKEMTAILEKAVEEAKTVVEKW